VRPLRFGWPAAKWPSYKHICWGVPLVRRIQIAETGTRARRQRAVFENRDRIEARCQQILSRDALTCRPKAGESATVKTRFCRHFSSAQLSLGHCACILSALACGMPPRSWLHRLVLCWDYRWKCRLRSACTEYFKSRLFIVLCMGQCSITKE
jgi:hypothetical protein